MSELADYMAARAVPRRAEECWLCWYAKAKPFLPWYIRWFAYGYLAAAYRQGFVAGVIAENKAAKSLEPKHDC